MALIYQDGVTIDDVTRKVVGVGNLTGDNKGNYQNTGTVAPQSVIQSPTGQNISSLDPSYNAYNAQNKLAEGNKLTSSQIPLGGYVPEGDRNALPATSNIPDFNKDVYKPVETVVSPTGNVLNMVKKQPLTAGATPMIKPAENIDGAFARAGVKPEGSLAAQQAAQFGNKRLANDNFTNAAFVDLHGRKATAQELASFRGKGIQDVYNAIKAGVPRQTATGVVPGVSPQIPGANPSVPDTTVPPAPEIAAPDNTIDPIKLISKIQESLDSINKQIQAEQEIIDNTTTAFDKSINEIGNEVGAVAPLLQGEQAYQERAKQINLQAKEMRLQRLVDEKANVIESGNLQMKAYEYARQLRKDQQEATEKILDMYLQNGTPITKEIADQYSALTGINSQFIQDAFAVSAKNYLQNKKETQDMQMLQAGYKYVSTPAELTALKKQGYDIVAMNGRSYAKQNEMDAYKEKALFDASIDKSKALFEASLKGTATTTDGEYGGECGDYVHTIVDNVPPLGDTWETKKAAMNISPQDFASAPQAGDVVAFKTKLPYGHVAIVNAVNGNMMTLTESNWNGDKKVTTTRKVSITDPTILGAYRGGTAKPTSPALMPGWSDDAINLAAENYLQTKNLPAVGLSKEGAGIRGAIISRAAQIAKSRGMDSQAASLEAAAYKADSLSLTTIMKQKDFAMSFEKTASKNLDLALSYSNKVDRTGSPLINKWALFVKGQYAGDKDVLALAAAIKTATNEYAKVVTGQTGGAAVSDSARAETEKMLNAAYSPQAFQEIVSLMKQEMNNRKVSYEEQINEINTRLINNQKGTTNSNNSRPPLSSFEK
jgi:hypothetical protein